MTALAISIAMTGCGGGSGASSPVVNTPPQVTTIPDGLYNGKTSNGRTITGLILDDGSYYVLYSGINNPSVIGGFVQGNGSALNGKFTSNNGKDYSFEGLGVLSANVSADYVLATSFNGSLNYPSLNQTGTFTSSYDKRYELTPVLSTITGTYTGSALGDPTTLTISPSGTITGQDSGGCAFSGTIAPRSKGNVYNTAITFGGSPCQFVNTTWSGVGYFDSPSKTIYSAVLNSAKNNGSIFIGTKP